MYETNQYLFPLSTFQKYAIEGIIQGEHVLITAPTGSGKTLPADFAITHFTSLGKKVIYTTPIKALSNQKFYEFSQKYPDITFGILTGDIKINPQAQVLIMTAEILLNTLYSYDSTKTTTTTSISHTHFQMDIATELACVIMDEVHYINDKERGHVWEETIMLLPQNIQMIMLSATLATPDKFARWCETRHQTNHQKETPIKHVYLASETHRSVPLTHYSFITFTNSIFKKIKDKAIQAEIHATINRPFVIQSAKGEFNEPHYFKMKKMLDYQVQVPVKRQHVLNQVSKYMVDHDMLPALCFVLSRKSLEKCAHEVTTVLLEDDSKVPYIVRHECEQILRKLPNYKEYLELPEYNSMVQLLEKGIAIHHAGVMPILREMVELLYAKGYIKLLFATETFAIGLNMPTKTVLFTDCNKYDGTSSRTFYSHEYTQMAGRAGRRGIDTVGNVIHLNNLFKNTDLCSYKTMLRGIPQTLVSKFKISYHLVLMNQTPDFIKHSMIHREINNELTQFIQTKNNIEKEIANYKNTISLLKTPHPVIQQYINYTRDVASCVNKKRKEYERSIKSIEEEYKTIKSDKTIIEHYDQTIQKLDNTISQIEFREKSGSNEHDMILQILIRRGFIEYDETTETTDTTNTRLTLKGQIAAKLKEIPCISFTLVIEKLRAFSAKELIAIFSCFTNIVVSEECKSFKPLIHSSILDEIGRYIEEFQDMQDSSSSIHYDLLQYMEPWIQCENTEECKHVLQMLQKEKDICVGDFVKAVLKINTISAEFETVAEMMGDYHFLSLLKEIPGMTLKYIATNQSLYV
jgi:superfamily II RNA helicase